MAFYGKQIDNIWVTGQLHDLFPNITAPSTEFLIEQNCLEVNAFKAYNAETEKLVTVPAYVDNGNLYIVEVQQLTTEELATIAAQKRQVLVSQASVISMRQARLALLQKSLLDVVDAAVLAMSDEVKITWEYATEVRIDDPLVIEVKKALMWVDAYLEDLFIVAKTL
jgi:hypothetical protein